MVSPARVTKVNISILVPAFKRYGQLLRLIHFLNKAAQVPRFNYFLENVEVLIADGSPVDHDLSGQARLKRAISKAKDYLNIAFFSRPGDPMLARQEFLFSRSSGRYVAFLGDEDLPNLDFFPQATKLLDERHDIAAVGGRYADIKGFRKNKLFFCLQEGWLDSLEIAGNNPLLRLSQYCFQYYLGLPSVYYSLMVRDAVSTYLQIALRGQGIISLNDCESILQFSIFISGGSITLPTTCILRDYTMIGHNSTGLAWRSEEGKQFTKTLLATYLVKKGFYDDIDQACEYILSLNVKTYGPCSPRAQLQEIIDDMQLKTHHFLEKEISPDVISLASDSWRETAESCYSINQLEVIGLR
ncbi:MAG: hypothetical protein CBD15_007220, partial [Synechococcus sp. TMED155]